MHNIDERGKNMADTKKRHPLAPGKCVQHAYLDTESKHLEHTKKSYHLIIRTQYNLKMDKSFEWKLY